MPLRDYQLKGVELVYKSYSTGHKAPILVIPTGGGKTKTAVDIIKRVRKKNKRVLFMAHRRELITQAARALREEGIEPGIIMPGNPEMFDRPVQVASKDTLIRRLDRWSNKFDFIVIDECHRGIARTYTKVYDANPNAFILGLTATPVRNDGRGLGEQFDDIIQAVGYDELIEKGYLVEPLLYTASNIPDVSKIKSKMGDFDNEELAKIYDKPTITGNVIAHFKEHCIGRSTIVFCVNRKHAKSVYDLFVKNGISSSYLDGETPKAERDSILKGLGEQKYQVLINVDVCTEGFDCPIVSAIILLRPTKCWTVYIQAAGRGLRPYPGKTDCIVLDHAGNFDRHGFLEDEKIFTLDAKEQMKSKDKEKEISYTTCMKCYAVYKSKPACPMCGETKDVKTHIIKETEGQLKKMSRQKMRENKRLAWIKLLDECDMINGTKLININDYNAAKKKYKKYFGEKPNFQVGLTKKFDNKFNTKTRETTYTFVGYEYNRKAVV